MYEAGATPHMDLRPLAPLMRDIRTDYHLAISLHRFQLPYPTRNLLTYFLFTLPRLRPDSYIVYCDGSYYPRKEFVTHVRARQTQKGK